MVRYEFIKKNLWKRSDTNVESESPTPFNNAITSDLNKFNHNLSVNNDDK